MRASLAVVAATITLTFPSASGQIGAMLFGALAGITLIKGGLAPDHALSPLAVTSRTGAVAFIAFLALLIGLPLLAAATQNQGIAVFAAFFRAGSLVFGGGHVVLPLLQAAVVQPGWVSNDAFLAGYGAAQAVPGPLFSFSAFLGAVMRPEPHGWIGAAFCLAAIYLPSFLLILAVLPFWHDLRRMPIAQSALKGVNAAVVGVLLAALYQSVWINGIENAADFVLAAAAFLLLYMWATPPWLVVVLSALTGALIAAF